MAIAKETVTIKNTSKYGFYTTEDVGYYLGQKSGLKVENFEKGKTYQVLVFTSGTGKKYVNQIVGESLSGKAASFPGIDRVISPIEKEEKPGDDKILEVIKKEKKETDWDGIARGKVACAAYVAALQSPVLQLFVSSNDKADYKKLVEEFAELIIEKTWKHQQEK